MDCKQKKGSISIIEVLYLFKRAVSPIPPLKKKRHNMAKYQGKDITITAVETLTGRVITEAELFDCSGLEKDRWQKSVLTELCKYLGAGNTSTNRVLIHLLNIKTNENMIYTTLKDIAKDTGVSVSKVQKLVKTLIDTGVLKRKGVGKYMLKPGVLGSGMGSKQSEMYMMWAGVFR